MGEPTDWLTPPLREAYKELARLGCVHTVEIWEGDQLVGGFFGALIEGVFIAVSGFSLKNEAVKAGLIDVMLRLVDAGGSLVDFQMPVRHVMLVGAQELGRADFYERLECARRPEICLPDEPRALDGLLDLRRELRSAGHRLQAPQAPDKDAADTGGAGSE